MTYSANQQAVDELVMRALDVAATQTYLRYHPEDLAEIAELQTKLAALNTAVDVYVRARVRGSFGLPIDLSDKRLGVDASGNPSA